MPVKVFWFWMNSFSAEVESICYFNIYFLFIMSVFSIYTIIPFI